VRLQPVSTTRSLRAPFLTLGGGFAAVVAAAAIGILLFVGAFDTGLTTPLGGLDERRPMRNDAVERNSHKPREQAAARVRVLRQGSTRSAAGRSPATPPARAPGRPASAHSASHVGRSANSPGNSEVSPGRPASPGNSGANAGHENTSQGQGHAYGHSRGNGPERSGIAQQGGRGGRRNRT
jgi:hypothetical protein